MSAPEPAEIGPIIRTWWADHLADRQSGAARGLSARLRRAQGAEVLAEFAVHRLAEKLDTRDSVRLIRLARVLAELRGTSATSLPRLLGAGENPKLSPARFQRLLRADGEELTTALIRAIRGLGTADARVCAIGALGRDLWLWGDKTRARWAFDYFNATPPASLDPQSSNPDAPDMPEEATA